VPAEEGAMMVDAQGERELPLFERDEIARLWSAPAEG